MNQTTLLAIVAILAGTALLILAKGDPTAIAMATLLITGGGGVLTAAKNTETKRRKVAEVRRRDAEDRAQEALGETQSLKMDIDLLQRKFNERQAGKD